MSDIRVALVHNIVPPYRVSLFNEIARVIPHFQILLERETHQHRRLWTVNREDWRFPHKIMRTLSISSPFSNYAGDVALDLGAILDRFRPDVLVVNGWSSPASWQARRWAHRRVPLVGWFESSQSTGRYRGGMSDRLRRRFLEPFDTVLAPGKRSADYLRNLGFTGRLVTMPNSIDDVELRALPRTDGTGRALFIGELSSRKGFDLVLSARDKVVATCGGLDVCGVGPLQPEVESVEGGGLTYHGSVEASDRVRAFRRADVVLLPSRADPWPLAAVEAVVAGRRLVLGTGVASYDDLAVHGGHVQQMAEDSPSALLTALQNAKQHSPPERTATSYSPSESAAAFIDACHLAVETVS